eukprot:gnl/MRDRNA2_/MRDRNA2_99188_c0_seq1.p1 gnl/MRDRNA2_/MRDRNA2_99188_c0~~gnl/MRDRNA2_/MRDRNA2_99188_c0_seq1.p1  ORF type:complete len:1027 (-),score=196.27 gnl/MRDRNA2_/MRDRNA2_99188_c0_seq1:83-3163(-)
MPLTNPFKRLEAKDAMAKEAALGAPVEAFTDIAGNGGASKPSNKASVRDRLRAAAGVTRLLQKKDEGSRQSTQRSSVRRSYLRSADTLESTVHLSIIEAKGLRAMDRGESSDPFAVVLLNGKKEVFRTEVKKKTLNPVWNAECTFYVKPKDTEVVVSFFDDDWIGKADDLGKVVLQIREFPSPGEEKWFDLTSDEGMFNRGTATGSVRLRVEFKAATAVAFSGSAPYKECTKTRFTNVRNSLLRETEKITDVVVQKPKIEVAPFGFSLPGGDVEIDLGGLEDLERVKATEENGKLMVTHFALQEGHKLSSFSSDFFRSMPALRILNLSGCCTLKALPGLASATNLEHLDLSRCSALRQVSSCASTTMASVTLKASTTLRSPNLTMKPIEMQDKQLCPNLKFLDVHGCTSLPNTEVWPIVAPKIGNLDMKSFNAQWRQPVQRQALTVGCPLGHVLSSIDVGKCAGFRCSLCLEDQPRGSRIRTCQGCGFFLCKTCIIQDMGLVVAVVWPSPEASVQAQNEAPAVVGPIVAGTNFTQADYAWLVEASCKAGLRAKWKAALQVLQGAQKVSQQDKDAAEANEVRIQVVDHTCDDDNFDIVKDRSCFWGFSDFHMSASDLDACKSQCVKHSYGCFVLWRGTAYFKSKDVESCRQNLIITPRATTYLCLVDNKIVRRRSAKKGNHTLEEEELRQERERLAQDEAKEVGSRLDVAGLEDAPICQRFMPLIKKALPSKLFRCPLMGCTASVCISEMEEHKASCEWRLVRCEAGCGAMVPVKMKEHHESVEAKLLETMNSWNVGLMKQSIKNAEEHCAFCRQSEGTLHKARASATKVQKALARIKRSGAMDIPGLAFDLNNCTITLEEGLPLAPRQPPDDSAAFREGKEEEAMKILSSVASILNSFGISMAMEGHTGETEPPKFWQSLADNRSRFIVDIIESQFGVPKLRCIPYGKPGGGVTVNIRKAAFHEVFKAMDADKDGMMSRKEFEEVEISLGQWFNDMQLGTLRGKFDLKEKVNFKQFCEDCDVDWGE